MLKVLNTNTCKQEVMDIYFLVGNVGQYSSDDFQQENTEQQTQILQKN